jgi:hypothetical protein
MKKLFGVLLIALFLLSACAAGSQPAPTATVVVTPDASKSTPTPGFGTIRQVAGLQVLQLSSQPDNKSLKTGRALPGQTGKLLGLDETGTWALMDFDNQTGWVPVTAMDLTFAR